MNFPRKKYGPASSSSGKTDNSLHPAECGKIIRLHRTQKDKPWGSVGIKFDVISNNSDLKLISINGRMQVDPADWQTIIVTGKYLQRMNQECNEPAVRRQSTSNY